MPVLIEYHKAMLRACLLLSSLADKSPAPAMTSHSGLSAGAKFSIELFSGLVAGWHDKVQAVRHFEVKHGRTKVLPLLIRRIKDHIFAGPD